MGACIRWWVDANRSILIHATSATCGQSLAFSIVRANHRRKHKDVDAKVKGRTIASRKSN